MQPGRTALTAVRTGAASPRRGLESYRLIARRISSSRINPPRQALPTSSGGSQLLPGPPRTNARTTVQSKSLEILSVLLRTRTWVVWFRLDTTCCFGLILTNREGPSSLLHSTARSCLFDIVHHRPTSAIVSSWVASNLIRVRKSRRARLVLTSANCTCPWIVSGGSQVSGTCSTSHFFFGRRMRGPRAWSRLSNTEARQETCKTGTVLCGTVTEQK